MQYIHPAILRMRISISWEVQTTTAVILQLLQLVLCSCRALVAKAANINICDN